MPKYPHMSPKEADLWDRYLSWAPHKFIKLTYDLHIGDSAPIDPSWPLWLVALVEATSKLRVDVIGETENTIYIFEVKERAGMNALGQLLAYEQLYLKEHRPTKPVRKVIITDRTRSDVADVFPRFGIRVVIV